MFDMNKSFFELEPQRRMLILDSAYDVFSKSSYAKANMNDIAWKAGISKSLLFYYFRNKRELYLYLWNEAAIITYEAIRDSDVFSSRNLFEMMEKGLEIKVKLFINHPKMAVFALRAFLEKDPQVHDAIQASYSSWFARQASEAIRNCDLSTLNPDMDVDEMIEQIRLASEGYLYQMEKDGIDLVKLTADSRRMTAFWKKIYLRKNNHKEHRGKKKS